MAEPKKKKIKSLEDFGFFNKPKPGSDDQNRNAVPSGGSRGDVVSIADPQSNVTQPDVTKTHPTIRKLLPVLSMIENVYDYQNLKYFDHKSVGSQREFFLTLGATVKESVMEKVKKSAAFGILSDEACDISVTEQLITFVQYFDHDTGNVHVSYLSCQDVLEKSSSANAQAISDLLVDTVETSGLDIKKMTGFSSDGASVMVGKRGGVAALLRLKNPTLINIHCICHKLALSCTDSNEGITYIKEVELILRQLWSYFENSPKRMAAYLKLQMQFKHMNLSKGASKTVASRLKKACRTRWLSLDSSVKAVHNDYEALVTTLAQSQTEDAMALGLLKKIKTMKFLGTIYILKDVLPVLSNLSRVFQRDTFCFSSIIPEINRAKDKLNGILEEETPLVSLQSDIDSYTNISAELSMSPKVMDDLQSLFKKYITALKDNIDHRFGDSSVILTAFCIFDPVTVPGDSALFKEHGNREIQQIATHFFADNEEDRNQLKNEWSGIKYHLRDTLKPNIPQSVLDNTHKITTTEWCLCQLLSVTVYKQFFPKLCFVAEVAASLPVSNAWPERGASALKNIKTRHRNRIQNDLLDALMQVTVNGPKCEDAGELVKSAVSQWLSMKDRKKLAVRAEKSTSTAATAAAAATTSTESGMQTDDTHLVIGQDELRMEIEAAMKTLLLEEEVGESDQEDDQEDDSF
ncbi:E3 SUMO-protein ligase KIAA1586-like [Dreissena polymorpha]|uniref:E3 SUMO-protein ligase KIAA1586-like n=1 Tax=Dreissena polymorpha TaxID=45954 RepID=UPI0022649A76|nr:E3 SUMO-protein ligase KIAA1586-like [Dreissena polymorpha]